eukprot:m51a1_g7031 hypothetical protein (948) ;mRNA; f:72521-76410
MQQQAQQQQQQQRSVSCSSIVAGSALCAARHYRTLPQPPRPLCGPHASGTSGSGSSGALIGGCGSGSGSSGALGGCGSSEGPPACTGRAVLATAAGAAEAQARALRALSAGRRVLGYRGVDCEGLFGGAEAGLALCEASAAALRAQQRRQQQGQGLQGLQGGQQGQVWLAALWGSREYCEAHALYFKDVVGSYAEVRRARGSGSDAEAAFAEVEDNVFEGRRLRDVVLGTVAHVVAALSLAKAQVATARADRAYASVLALLRSGPGDDLAATAFDEECEAAAVREENELGLRRLEQLAAYARSVLVALGSLDLFERIDGALELPNASRKVVRSDAMTLVAERELGLSVTVPVRVIVVENGVLVALPRPEVDGRKRYRLVQWYPQAALRVMVPQADTAVAAAASAATAAATVALALRVPFAQQQQQQRVSKRQLFSVEQVLRLSLPSRAALTAWLAAVGPMASDGVVADEPRRFPCRLLGVPLDALLSLESPVQLCDNVPLVLRRSSQVVEVGQVDQFANAETCIYDDALALLGKRTVSLPLLLHLLERILSLLPAPLLPPEWLKGLREGRCALRELPADHAALLVHLSCLAASLVYSYGERCSDAELLLIRKLVAGDKASQEQQERALAALLQMRDDTLAAAEFARRPLAQQLCEFATLRRKLVGHSHGVRSLCLTPSGKHVWSVDKDGDLFIWHAQSGRFDRRVRIGIRSVTVSERVGDSVWVGHVGGVTVLSPETAAPVHQVLQVLPMSLLWLEGRGEVWCGCEDRLVVFDSTTRRVLRIHAADEYRGLTFIALAAASPSCIWAAGFRRTPNPQTEIHVFEAKEGVLVATRRIMAHSSRIASLVAIEGSMWALHEDSTLMIWNTDTCKCIHTMAWGGFWDQKIVIWDARTYGQVGELRGYHTESILDMLVRTDPATGDTDVWSASTDKSVCVWSVHNSMFSSNSN